MTNQSKYKTSLFDLHVQQGARMVDFADFAMPVQYTGIIEEHLHTRKEAGLFDVSHMGQIAIYGESYEQVSRELESVLSADIQTLKPGQQRYSLIMNHQGGVVDDCMISRPSNQAFLLFLVVNASRKAVDLTHLNQHISKAVTLEMLTDRSLISLQGPKSAEVLSQFNPGVADLKFMQVAEFDLLGYKTLISRSGYTGEDGFEVSIQSSGAELLARELLANDAVKLIGLGARDSLRLEAGMSLYGHEITEETSPLEANLLFAVGQNQRKKPSFLGGDHFLTQLAGNVSRLRVGLTLSGRLPARQGCQIVDANGELVGEITSGTYSPSLEYPIALAYVKFESAKVGNELHIKIRDKLLPATVVNLPFVSHQYQR